VYESYAANSRVHVIKEDRPERLGQRLNNKRGPSRAEQELAEIMNTETIDDVVMPFQQLLEDLTANRTAVKRARFDTKKKKVSAAALRKQNEEAEEEESEADSDETTDDDEEKPDSDGEIQAAAMNTHSQEVLCKDHLDSEESLKNGINLKFKTLFNFQSVRFFFW
jgi:hypothetical protein